MKFKKLAEKLQELEKTSSRNEMTEMLAELIKETDAGEADKVTYLLLGRLRSMYDSLEFNLGEKQIQKSIARMAGKEEAEVRKIYKEVGDLGEVVEKTRDQSSLQRRAGRIRAQELGVKEVFGELEKIALDGGQGSQDRKIEGLAELLKDLDPLSGRYVVRVVMGKLRLGFSDKTMLDALSWAMRGDKTAKKELEMAYQVRPDIGRLVAEVKSKGIEKAVKEVEMELGVPISPMLCQRLKSSEEMVKKMCRHKVEHARPQGSAGCVAVEPKFDGTRVQIHFRRQSSLQRRAGRSSGQNEWQVRTFTRNLEETTHMFPELLKMAEHVTADELVLDSEAVGYDPKTKKMLPFQMTITRKRKHGIGDQASKVPLKFYVFDVMYVDGKSLVDEPYEERRKILQSVVKDKELIVVDEHWETDDPEEIREKHESLLKDGLEGVIVKKLGSKYVPGRTGWRWVKMKEVEESHAKLSDTVDCVVMGYYRGKGKRTEFGVGAFLAGTLEGDKVKTVTKVGTGLTDEQFRELKMRLDVLVSREKPKEYEVDKNMEPDVWVEPKLIVELAADEVTKSPSHTSGVALRFPRLIAFRDDKGLEQTTTVEEMKNM